MSSSESAIVWMEIDDEISVADGLVVVEIYEDGISENYHVYKFFDIKKDYNNSLDKAIAAAKQFKREMFKKIQKAEDEYIFSPYHL